MGARWEDSHPRHRGREVGGGGARGGRWPLCPGRRLPILHLGPHFQPDEDGVERGASTCSDHLTPPSTPGLLLPSPWPPSVAPRHCWASHTGRWWAPPHPPSPHLSRTIVSPTAPVYQRAGTVRSCLVTLLSCSWLLGRGGRWAGWSPPGWPTPGSSSCRGRSARPGRRGGNTQSQSPVRCRKDRNIHQKT